MGEAQDVREAYQRAVSLHQAGDLEAAVAAYREVLDLEPGNPAAQSNLGAALAALGRYEEAIAAYQAALSRVSNPGIRYNLALARYKSGDVTGAAEERIRAAADGIRRRDFPPQPTWMACGQCPFREICPHTARGSEAGA